MIERVAEKIMDLPYKPFADFGENYLNYYHQGMAELSYPLGRYRFYIEKTPEVRDLAFELSKEAPDRKAFLRFLEGPTCYRYRFFWTETCDLEMDSDDLICLTKDYEIHFRNIEQAYNNFAVTVKPGVFKQHTFDDYNELKSLR